MSESDLLFRYQAHSRAFLNRGRGHLAEFKSNGNVSSFHYAALELRFAIEARISEYLRPALKRLGKNPNKETEYVASKLLKKLAAIAPDSERHSVLRVASEQNGSSVTLRFTPVSRELASIHGKIGEFLHFKFFLNNEHWLIRKPLGSSPHRSLMDCCTVLEDAVTELEQATAGTLLGHPQFTALVDELLNESESERGRLG